jgi:hypothetical protein
VRAQPAPLHIPILFSRLGFFQWGHFIRKTTWRQYAPGRIYY